MKNVIIFLCLMSSLWAGYMGNPALPSLVEQGMLFSKDNTLAFHLNYQRDWVLDTKMKTVTPRSGLCDTFTSTADLGVVTVNAFRRLELYGKAGVSRIAFSHHLLNGIQHVYQFKDSLTWGWGGRALLASWGAVSCAVQMGYEKVNPHRGWMSQAGIVDSSSFRDQLKYHHWQLGIGGAYQTQWLTPYLGLKYTNGTVELTQRCSTVMKIKNRHKFGLVVGTSLTSGEIFSATIELRMVDEQALTFSADIVF